MSREIKFRAWEDNKMYYQVRCGGMFDGIPTAPDVWDEGAGDWSNLTGQPYTKVMQYTGLKDKNGKEIYEGDIVKGYYDEFDTYFAENNRHEFTSDVKYITNSFKVDRDTVNGEGRIRNYGYQGVWDSETVEVIGNIYENPELLEVTP